jgi:60S ribosome subunit biogenesis protein NIP7
MRPLTDEETKIFFEKLNKYIGRNIKHLIERPDGEYCFRLHKDRVYYMSAVQLKAATSVERDSLVAMGTCFGKFTKTHKFRMYVTCLDYLAQYATYKVWIKSGKEMSYLYGNNILKAHLGRITEDTPKYQGVVVYTMSDVPIGFGVTAHSTRECRKLDPTAVVCFHQADVGEYLREESTMMSTSS